MIKQQTWKKLLKERNKSHEEVTMTAPDADNLKFKIYKPAGNDIFVKEVVQHLNLKAKQWILDLLENWARLQIFGEWRK